MALSDQRHTFRFPLPHEAVYNAASVFKAPVYLSGALVTPSSGTITIYDESNEVVINAAAVTVSGSIAQYTLAADTFASTDISERFRAVWALTISGTVYTAENDGIVVARLLYPVIADEDLFRRLSALDPNGTAPITAKADYQNEIDESWAELIGRMIAEGIRPSWVMSPSATRRAHTELALSYVFEDLASRLEPAYDELAQRHRRAYDAAWGRMVALIDADDDGIVDHRGRKGFAFSGFWMGKG